MSVANKLKLIKIIVLSTIMISLCVSIFFIVRTVINNGKDGNDSTSTATLITPYEAYKEFSYTNSINGSVTKNDKDYYSIVLLSDSYLSVTINTSFNNEGYEYYLLKVSSSDTLEVIDSDTSSNWLKQTESLYLKAGTYYILIKGVNDANKDYKVDYKLTIEVTMVDEKKVYDIGDLKYSRALPGAVWVSDYIPFNDTNPLSLDSLYEYLVPTKKNVSHSTVLFDYLNTISNGESIKLATYYLWDIDLIKELIDIFDELLNRYQTSKEDNYTDEINVDSVISALKIIKTYVGIRHHHLTMGGSLDNTIVFSVYYKASLKKSETQLVYYPFNDNKLGIEFFEYEIETNEIDTMQGYSNGTLYMIDSMRSSFNFDNLKLVEEIPYPKPDIFPIEHYTPPSIDSTSHGGISWYSYTAKTSGTYSIYAYMDVYGTTPSYDDVDYVLSLFKEEPQTTMDNNYFITKHGGYYTGDEIGTIITLDLEANETIYIKISSKDGEGFGNGIINARQGIPPMEELPLS